MIKILGLSVGKMTRSIGRGNGCLIFFPSYKVMKECIENWVSNQINFDRTLRYEDKDPEENQKNLKSHIEDCTGDELQPGAILAGVCRARIAEGIDFKDS